MDRVSGPRGAAKILERLPCMMPEPYYPNIC